MEKAVSKNTEGPEFENPKQFLLRKINSRVEVLLKWGQSYEGVLASVDDYFNVLLSKAVEKVDNEVTGELSAILIRCNNVYIIREPRP